MGPTLRQVLSDICFSCTKTEVDSRRGVPPLTELWCFHQKINV